MSERVITRLAHRSEAVRLIGAWHSMLPSCKGILTSLAFVGEYESEPVGAALWGNTSARTLPQTWLELRRFAIGPGAPHCAASQMLGQMRRWILHNCPDVERLVSYQAENHKGTIYAAANWTPAFVSKARVRDRSVGLATRDGRTYRTDAFGAEVAHGQKIRWELILRTPTEIAATRLAQEVLAL